MLCIYPGPAFSCVSAQRRLVVLEPDVLQYLKVCVLVLQLLVGALVSLLTVVLG